MLILFGAACGTGFAQTGTSFGLYVYPPKGQNETQQINDESVCYKSAVARTGIDPTNLPPAATPQPTLHQGGAARGAARGAAGGAIIGAITGNAGEGAAVGAVLGGARGYAGDKRLNEAEKHYAVASAQEHQSKQMTSFRRAYGACLESKGYTVK